MENTSLLFAHTCSHIVRCHWKHTENVQLFYKWIHFGLKCFFYPQVKKDSINQSKEEARAIQGETFFIANFQRELTNFLYYDRISILRIGPIDNVKAEEVLSALCACWILNMSNCWASVCSMISGQVSSDRSLLFKLYLGHDPNSWLYWMSHFKVVITMHVITKESGRAKKSIYPCVFYWIFW